MHIKPFIKKAKKRKVDIQLALLNIRATPIDGNLHSPGELLFASFWNTPNRTGSLQK